MTPLRLHLGCGRQLLAGYVNIDAAARPGAVPALERDVLELRFPPGSVSEIRHHHLFEHFHRYQAVALMAAWNQWLAPGGRLVIETPDFHGSARRYLRTFGLIGTCRRLLRKRDLPRERALVLRHLFGSKEAPWANHLEGWDAVMLGALYARFGFKVTGVEASGGEMPNVTVAGHKTAEFEPDGFRAAAESFLKPMAWSPGELEVWLAGAQSAWERLQAASVVEEALLAGWRSAETLGR
jgi:predicted SAM-dependent methyltransferase